MAPDLPVGDATPCQVIARPERRPGGGQRRGDGAVLDGGSVSGVGRLRSVGGWQMGGPEDVGWLGSAPLVLEWAGAEPLRAVDVVGAFAIGRPLVRA